MQGQVFRLKTPTLGIISSDDGHQSSMMIPADAILTVTIGAFNNNRLVDVLWEGKTVMMFAQDLQTRGERMHGASATP